MKAEILDDIWKLLPMALEEAFPGRTFQLERVGERFRLTGDLDFQGK